MSTRMYLWPAYRLEVDAASVTFGKSMGRIVARLYRSAGQFVSTATLIEALYGDDEDGGPLNPSGVIAVHVCRANHEIEPLGVHIVGHRGCGVRCMVLPGMKKPLIYGERELFGHTPTDPRRFIAPKTPEVESWSVGNFLDEYN